MDDDIPGWKRIKPTVGIADGIHTELGRVLEQPDDSRPAGGCAGRRTAKQGVQYHGNVRAV